MLNIQRSFEATDGKLYLVATPIGNLEDMTYRAVRILQEVDLIAAEDTRQTRKLLSHFQIRTKIVSYHEHNKQASGPELVSRMERGQSIALVSDAGLPAISDPGADLVSLAVERDIPVIPIPGANAALSALIISGLSTEEFVFIGFLPRQAKKTRVKLQQYANTSATIIVYESPHRLRKTLQQLYEVWGDRHIALTRELTKRYEEVIRGTIRECLEWLEENEPKGEYCLIIEGATAGSEEQAFGMDNAPWWQSLTLQQHVKVHEERTGNRKEALKLVATERNMPKREVYHALINEKS